MIAGPAARQPPGHAPLPSENPSEYAMKHEAGVTGPGER